MPKIAPSLDTQTRFVSVIFGRDKSPINQPFNSVIDQVISWCKINASFYAFIGHAEDVNEDDTPKFRHIHGVIVLKDGVKPRLSTTLNRLSQVTKLPQQDIDIDMIGNLRSSIRYLTHIDYPLKHQYQVEEVRTNLSQNDLEDYFKNETDYFTAKYLIQLVSICNYSVVHILSEIGLKNYCRYRNVIQDLIKELNN